MKKQKALIIIKPDGVQRGLIGRIVSRFESVGLKIIGLNGRANLQNITKVIF